MLGFAILIVFLKGREVSSTMALFNYLSVWMEQFECSMFHKPVCQKPIPSDPDLFKN